MKQLSYLFLAIYLMAECFLNAQDQFPDSWLEDWVSAIELSQDSHTCSKAIEKYTSSIQTLNPNQVVILLNLVTERGNLYLKMLEFDNALKDFPL